MEHRWTIGSRRILVAFIHFKKNREDKMVIEETSKEDRKDNRTKIQASQQSELINQRETKAGPKNFESSGNDVMQGGFNLGSFEPR